MEKKYGFKHRLRCIAELVGDEALVDAIIEKTQKTQDMGLLVNILESDFELRWEPGENDYFYQDEDDDDTSEDEDFVDDEEDECLEESPPGERAC